jgi:hypothetical protein
LLGELDETIGQMPPQFSPTGSLPEVRFLNRVPDLPFLKSSLVERDFLGSGAVSDVEV